MADTAIDGYLDRTFAFCASSESNWHIGFGSVPAERSAAGTWEGVVELVFAEVAGDCDALFGDMAYDTAAHTLESLQCVVSGSINDCTVEQVLACTYEDAAVDLALSLDWAGTHWEGTGQITSLMPSNAIDCTSTYHVWADP